MPPRFSFTAFYTRLSNSMRKYGMDMMRLSLAIIFVWFGALKIAGLSPAENLVEHTVYWFPARFFIPFLGWAEMAIGVGLLIRRLIPYTIVFLLLHMACTFLPFFICPSASFDSFPFGLSLLGQYIVKNLVLISGAVLVGGSYDANTRK